MNLRTRGGPMLPSPSRRRFVQGLAYGGVAAGLGLWRPSAGAPIESGVGRTLTGTRFDLEINTLPVNFTGASRLGTTVNGLLPGPLLRWREGTTVTLRVTNLLAAPTSIHWHGVLVPADMDGVPGLSFPGIAPGETFTYRFPVRQSGTYWYHAHSGFQEQTGLYGALVIDPVGADPIMADRDYVIMLNDWSDEDPTTIFARLKKQSDYYAVHQPTVGDFLADVQRSGWHSALASRAMWNRMRMSPRDLIDVSGRAYTYLMNGITPAGNWTGLFEAGERVRLRFINGASNSYFDVRIPGLVMHVVAADGQNVSPVAVDEFRIGAAEVYDVIVEPRENRAYTIFAQSIDRSGYARGTLAPRFGMEAEVPALDPVPTLAMSDMMGAMGGHGMDMEMPGMDRATMHAMSHDIMSRGHHTEPGRYGPGVDMRVDSPRTNLDDPGVGLRDNGRRVLSYADLHTDGGSLYEKQPTRDIELHLTGNMRRFMWSFDGVKFSDAEPIRLRYGERVRLVLINDTMMTHPIHLHGMWSELESPDGAFQVRKHTISVQPAQRICCRVQADPPGRWALHCHLLYHMEAGMFREVVVA